MVCFYQDQEETGQQHYGKVYCVMMGRMKFEQDVELHKPSSMCTTSYASFRCSKSRQKLTEDLKFQFVPMNFIVTSV